VTHGFGRGSSLHIYIAYSYAVDGRQYRGSRYQFFDNFTSIGLDRYHIGPNRGISCYVNPQNPADSVLDRGIPQDGYAWFIVLGGSVPFFGFGALVLVGLVRTLVFGPPRLAKHLHADGPSILECRWPPLTGIVVFGFVFLFGGGGFAGMLLLFAAPRPNEFFTWADTNILSVLIPTGVAAAFMGGLFVNSVFVAMCPRAVLTLNPGRVALGDRADLKWEFTGSTARIRSLRLSLKGIQSKRHKDNVFFDKRLVLTSDPQQIAAGEIKIRVPRDSKSSWDASDGKVIWSIHMQANIPWWPNIDADYVFLVTPRADDAAFRQ
jgi:hypothetical protein